MKAKRKKANPIVSFLSNTFAHSGYYDYTLKFIIYLLLILGLIILYSSSSYVAKNNDLNASYYFWKQLRNTLLGLVLCEAVARVNYNFWRKFAVASYLVAMALTFMVYFTPFGVAHNGAKRWINLFGIEFQPAEFAKLAIILFLAAFICEAGKSIRRKKTLGVMIVLTGILGGCVYVFTDNLSTGIIVMAIGTIMAFVTFPEYKQFIIIGAVAAVLLIGFSFFIVNTVELTDDTPFRIKRIFAWLKTEEYADSVGYQTMQSLYAIGSGGLFGKGLGNSIQKLGFVPEAENDMIFAIFCEEFGLVGAIALIIIFGVMIWRFLIIALNAPNLFGSLLAIGVLGHIAVQVILNIAVVTNTIPNTGITLPFISYGGTSILFLLTEMGIVLNISSQMRE